MAAPDNDEIRRPRLPGHKLVWQFERGAPFDLLEALPLGAKPFSHLFETGHHPLTIGLSWLSENDDAACGKCRLQGQARDPDQGCVEAVRQRKRKLDPLFRIALNVQMNHDRFKGHCFPFDSIYLSEWDVAATRVLGQVGCDYG